MKWNGWCVDEMSACLKSKTNVSSLIIPTPIPQSQPPQFPAVASSPSIWAHVAASPLPLLEGIDHVHLDLQGIWKVNFGRRLFMP